MQVIMSKVKKVDHPCKAFFIQPLNSPCSKDKKVYSPTTWSNQFTNNTVHSITISKTPHLTQLKVPGCCKYVLTTKEKQNL